MNESHNLLLYRLLLLLAGQLAYAVGRDDVLEDFSERHAHEFATHDRDVTVSVLQHQTQLLQLAKLQLKCKAIVH